jgi:hypothetical protein
MWEVVVSVILSKKKVYMYMCPIPNGFRDRAISLYSTVYSHELQNAPMLTVEFSKMYCDVFELRHQ